MPVADVLLLDDALTMCKLVSVARRTPARRGERTSRAGLRPLCRGLCDRRLACCQGPAWFSFVAAMLRENAWRRRIPMHNMKRSAMWLLNGRDTQYCDIPVTWCLESRGGYLMCPGHFVPDSKRCHSNVYVH